MNPHFNSELPRTTLGLFIRDKRTALRLSLRAFADKINSLLEESEEVCYLRPSEIKNQRTSETKFSAGFLSDIENGRRYPSDRVLQAIADALGVDEKELREKDHRMPTDELQRLQMLNPQFGFAFRRAVNYIQEKELTPQEVWERICSPQPPKQQ